METKLSSALKFAGKNISDSSVEIACQAASNGARCRWATKDPAIIERWFVSNPEANYGIATGGDEKIGVLDIDGPEGRASLKAFIEKYGNLPKTVTVKTANGKLLLFSL